MKITRFFQAACTSLILLLGLLGCKAEKAVPTPTLPPIQPPTIVADNTDLVITFMDVGTGDAILVQAPGGAAALIDGGSDNGIALAYLQAAGISSLDMLIATHAHADHLGGLDQVVRALSVKQVVTNGQPDINPIYNHFMKAVETAEIPLSTVKRGDTIALGPLTFDVLHPGAIATDDLNQNSMVLRLAYAGTTILFMGDAKVSSEVEMMNAGLDLSADILKVGHHGSCDASSHKFLDVVKPAAAVYSAEADNTHLLPCQAVLHALDVRNVATYGTDTTGTIILVVGQAGYKFTNGLGQALN